MPIFTVGAAGTTSSSYEVANSLRFDSGQGGYLSLNQSTATSARKMTYSTWIKLSKINDYNILLENVASPHNSQIVIQDNGNNNDLRFYDYDGSTNLDLRTSMAFRDVSAWYHIVVAMDTTQSTSSNRVKIYVNGSQLTAFDTETYPSQNYDTGISDGTLQIGRQTTSSYYIDGYLAETVFVDGQQLGPTDFGEFDSDTNIWKPKEIDTSSITFGNNGFYLNYANSGALGTDAAGSNNLTSNNFTAVDQSTDTPTNNFATMNALSNNNSNYVFTEGNLKVTETGSWLGSVGTIGLQSGKWYWEVEYGTGNVGIGIGKVGTSSTETANLGSANNGYSSKYPDGYEWFKNFSSNIKRQNNNTNSNYGTNPSDGSIMMIAFDADNGTIWAGNNGTWFASATQSEIEAGTTTNSMYSGITIDDFFLPTASIENGNLTFNFGSPSYSISSGNSDENGHGNFEYAVPSGYYAINTKNLAEFG